MSGYLIGMVLAVPAWLLGLWSGLRTRQKACGCGHGFAYHDLADSRCRYEVSRTVRVGQDYDMLYRQCPCAHFTGTVG